MSKLFKTFIIVELIELAILGILWLVWRYWLKEKLPIKWRNRIIMLGLAR